MDQMDIQVGMDLNTILLGMDLPEVAEEVEMEEVEEMDLEVEMVMAMEVEMVVVAGWEELEVLVEWALMAQMVTQLGMVHLEEVEVEEVEEMDLEAEMVMVEEVEMVVGVGLEKLEVLVE